MRHRTAVLTALALAGAACARPHSNADAFEWTQQLPAGAIVHLRDGSGNIDVRASNAPAAHIVASTRWRRGRETDIHFVVTPVGANEYYVCAMWRASGQCGESGYRGARANRGILTMFSLFHHGTDALANFVAELPANVVVDASTVNGTVRIDGAAAGVTGKSTNGTVVASHVSGPIDLTTVNGEVRVSADSLGAADPVKLSTINGAVVAELPASLQGDFDLRVTNGVVRSDFALAPSSSSRRGNRHLQGQIGSSTRPITMRAVNGMVTVKTAAKAP